MARWVLRHATAVIAWLKETTYLTILGKWLRALEDHIGLLWYWLPPTPHMFVPLQVYFSVCCCSSYKSCHGILYSPGLDYEPWSPKLLVCPVSTPQLWTHFGTANIVFHRKLSSLNRTGLENCQQLMFSRLCSLRPERLDWMPGLNWAERAAKTGYSYSDLTL